MKQLITTTFNIEEKEVQSLKDTANFLMDLNDACLANEGANKIVFEGIDTETLANLLSCFEKTSDALVKVLALKTEGFLFANTPVEDLE